MRAERHERARNVSSTTDAPIAQPGSALTAIVIGFGLLPGICVLLSLLPVAGYQLRATDLQSAPPPTTGANP